MRIFVVFFCLTIGGVASGYAQQVLPFIDFNNYFRNFDGEAFQFIEMQQIGEIQKGDELVAYRDIRGNLRAYDRLGRHEITTQNADFHVSDHFLAWQIAHTIQCYADGKIRTLSLQGENYVVKDSLILFKDFRFNSLLVYDGVNSETVQISTGDLKLVNSSKIGENIFVFNDNGNLYKIWYKGQIHEIGVWYGDIQVSAGTDILAFNDPTTRTFAVFDAGEFIDVEQQWVKSYQSGRNFVAYEDPNGNLKYYRLGNTREISNFPGRWQVVDDVLFYEDNGWSYVYIKGEKTMAANYLLEEFQLKNDVFAFRTLQGGISVVQNGRVHEITNMPNAEFEVIGSSVIVKLQGGNVLVYYNGKVWRN